MARRVLRAFAIVLVTALVVPVATAGTVLAAFLFLPLPASVPEPQRTIDAAVSRVYDIDGNEIGQFRRFDAREPVRPEDIPQVLKDAVVSAEDRRFYEHGGVDLRGTLRALWADIRAGSAVQGGSTITQQYVKNAYVGSERSLTRKVREAVLASQIDRQYEKDEILFRYLDQVYLGEGAYGVGAAAETYFRKRSVSELTLSEAALLAGIIPAPSRYEPRGHAEAAEGKRVLVLDAMLRNGRITPEQHAEAVQQRIHLAVFGPPPEGQPVTVVHPRETPHTSFPYFVDYVRNYLERRYGDEIVYRRGLDIYTTMDQRIQSAAQEEIAATTEGMPEDLQMALAAIEPGSGYVMAVVGGRDFNAPGGQVNIAIPGGGGSSRQTGSGYKPLVLAAAFEQGVSPDKTYSGRNGLVVAGEDFNNFGGSSYGSISLREATKRSVNTVYVQLLQDVGVEETMEVAKRHGLSRSVFDPARHGLSVALGAEGAFPLEMASAYGTWAARGERATPTPVLRVIDSDGKVLEDNIEPRKERVVGEVTADTMNEILQGVFTPGGTAGGRGLKGRPAAGKTGTTNRNIDAWFTGYTPQLSASVWIGYRQPAPLQNIKGVRGVTGGTFPAQTWQRFMERVHADLPVVDFTEPAPITPVADEAKREARRGFEVGTKRRPAGTDDGGRAEEDLPPPTVEPPPERTTTTTTQPGIDLGPPGDDDGGEDASAGSPFP